MSAAFDTLSKDIFCSKLKAYGFDDVAVSWFESYLSGRSQVVIVGASISEECRLTVGSPQGAILSTTIFIILVSDVGLWTKSAITSYADDTTASISHTDLSALVKDCEEEAENIIKFMSANRLAANTDKTHVLIMRRKMNDNDNLIINVGNHEIKESSSENLLGMIVENDLTWNAHVKNMVKKLKYRLFTLRRLSHCIPMDLLRSVACGIFLSVIRYWLPLYCPLRLKEEDPNPGIIKELKVVFNDCLRLLTSKRREDHASIKSMLEELNWCSINQLSGETRLLEAWKTVHLEKYCMKDVLSIKKKSEYMSTRSNDTDMLEQGIVNKFSNARFVNMTAKIWNGCPREIKEEPKFERAKILIKEYCRTLPI